jgi:dTDP-4-dehydrorhamnose reductase
LKPRLALIGANGMLARKVNELAPAGYELHCFDLPEFDIADRNRVLALMARLHPAVIINCAAYTNVDGAESDELLAMRINGAGPANLALAAKQVGATLVHVSTDYVFDGTKTEPYLENDPVAPRSAYGRTKLAGEQSIIESGLTNFYLIRTSWLYGPGGKNFVETIVRLATEREELRIVDDQIGSPTYTADLAQAIFALLLAGEDRAPHGIYHYANEGQASWYEFACAIVALMQQQNVPVKARRVLPIKTEEYPLPAQRPAYSVFSKAKFKAATGAVVPGWRESLATYMELRVN